MTKALLVIDLQNDYFADGKFPLWRAADTLASVERAIRAAHEKRVPVILIQHVANPKLGPAPFLTRGREGQTSTRTSGLRPPRRP